MSKFLEGNVSKRRLPEKEDRLTVSSVRSMIPGDFRLVELRPDQSVKFRGMTHCFVVFHEKGVFVIYSCNQDGIIHGDVLQQQWMSYNYLGDGISFESPIMTNQKNIGVLSDLFKLPKTDFHSCILFPNLSELRKVPADTLWQGIIHEDMLEIYFSKLLPKLEPRYSYTQLNALHDIFNLVSGDIAI